LSRYLVFDADLFSHWDVRLKSHYKAHGNSGMLIVDK